jgi:hypothetical protein
MAFESVSRFSDFQAEYEGSIPFTAPRFSAPRYDLVRFGTPLCEHEPA